MLRERHWKLVEAGKRFAGSEPLMPPQRENVSRLAVLFAFIGTIFKGAL